MTGPPVDNGDGSYTVPVVVDAGADPGVVITQSGLPPVVVGPPKPAPPPLAPGEGCRKWKWLFWILLLIIAILLVLLF